LPRRDNLRNTKLYAFHASTRRNHVDAVMRLQSERLRVPWIHLQPRVWREPFEDRNVSCFRARMPMLDGAAGIQHERKVRVRLRPSRKKIVVASELFCQTQKDVEVGAGLSRWFHGAIDLAHAAFRIRIGAFFFSPDSRREDKVRDFGRRRRMKSILNYQKIQA